MTQVRAYLTSEECWNSSVVIMSLLLVGARKRTPWICNYTRHQSSYIPMGVPIGEVHSPLQKLSCPMPCTCQGYCILNQTPLEPMACSRWVPFLQDPSLPRTVLEKHNTYISSKFLPKFLWGLLRSLGPNLANLHMLWNLPKFIVCSIKLTHSPHLPYYPLALLFINLHSFSAKK